MSDRAHVEIIPSEKVDPTGEPIPRRPRRHRAYATLTGFLLFGIIAAFLIGFADEIVEHSSVPDRAVVYICAFILGIAATLFLLNAIVTLAGFGGLTRLLANALAVVGLFCLLGVAFQSGYVQFDGSMVPSLRLPRTMAFLPGKVEGSDADAVDLSPELADGERIDAAEGDGTGRPVATSGSLAGTPEWSGFLGPNRDGAGTDPGLATDWNAATPELVWRHEIGEGWSSFAVWGDRIFTQEQRGRREYVACYGLADGKPIWSVYRETRHAEALGGVGPRATPTLANGCVYAAGATGDLFCLDAATGAEVWNVNLRELVDIDPQTDLGAVMWGRSASPLVVDDRVYIPGGGRVGKRSTLLCLDAKRGDVLWRSGDDQISYASPTYAVIDDVPQVLEIGEQTVAGYDAATGEILWSHPWTGSSSGNATCSQPQVLARNRVLLSKGYGGGAEMLRVGKVEGSGEWVVESLWKNARALGTKFTNVVVREEHAYGLSDGILECVDLESGKRAWRDGRYGHGQVLLVGKLLIVQGEQGEVALVEASPEEFRELGRFEALTGKTWNNPVLVGDILLVRNSDEMAAWRLPLR